MTTTQKMLVRKSFEAVKPIAQDAGMLFYGRLFHVDPSLRALFRQPIQDQARVLMQMLAAAVGSLERLDTLVPALEDMGRRHLSYGVRAEHYQTVGECLLWTLQQGLGEAFTPEVREAWVTVYGILAGAMQRGAARVEQTVTIEMAAA